MTPQLLARARASAGGQVTQMCYTCGLLILKPIASWSGVKDFTEQDVAAASEDLSSTTLVKVFDKLSRPL